MNNILDEEYIKDIEPCKREKAYSWNTAIGLQKVDGLDTSEYLKELAIKNINGELTHEHIEKLINSYYKQKPVVGQRTNEADIVAIRISQLLDEKSFVLSPIQLLDIHKRLFSGIYDFAGQYRTYNITKNEWVLDGDTVTYGGSTLIKETLEYDFSVEKSFDYSNVTDEIFIKHIARFISNMWQIHIFGEGNTRTTAVFLIKYLRFLGYDVTNDLFANNSWYFRNALVRANYTNVAKGIRENTIYLEKFFENLLFGKNNELRSRELHINYQKVNIEESKVNIEESKVNIDSFKFTNKTNLNIKKLYDLYKDRECFGRGDVEISLNISSTAAHKLLLKMKDTNIIVPVLGKGKGKYKFNI